MLQFPENEKHKLFKNQSTDKDIVKLLEFFQLSSYSMQKLQIFF